MQNTWKDAIENNLQSVTEMPYFEGDLWPNILEECIKEIDKKKNSMSRKMSSSRKSKSGGTDLAGKLLSTMDKHKEVFLGDTYFFIFFIL